MRAVRKLKNLKNEDIIVLKCPTSQDASIKEFYSDLFPEVFISLKPFLKLNANAPMRDTPDKWTSAQIREHMQAVRWKEMMELSALPSLQVVNHALVTGIGALEVDDQDEESSEQLFETLETHRISPPEEDLFSSVDLKKVLLAIRECGYSEVLLDDEWGSLGKQAPHFELTDENIESINYDDMTQVEWGVITIYTPDHHILFASPFDRHYSLLCGKKETLNKIITLASLEGFYADSDTTLNWGITE